VTLAIGLALAPAALADVTETPGDAGFVIAGSRTNAGFGIVRIRSDEDNNGTYETITSTFYPYGGTQVVDGVRVATGDFDGDGNDELAVSAGNGLPVQIYDLNPDGTPGGLVESAVVFGKRGVFVAAGDLNGDGRDELIVGAGSGAPTVRIYSDVNVNGRVFDEPLQTFTAFPSTFKGGVTVALANTNNIGGDELVTGQASIGRRITVWTDADANRMVEAAPLESFLAYGSSYKGGVSVASGAIESTGGGGAEIVYAPAHGKGAVTIRTDTNANGLVSDNPASETFLPYGSSYAGGVRLAAGDTDHSGFFAEVVTAPATYAQKRTAKIYDDSADLGSLLHDNPITQAFKPMPTMVKLAGSYLAVGVVRTIAYVNQSFPQTIADLSTLNSEFWIPPSAGKIRDLDFMVNLMHSFDGDLDLTLTHVSTGTTMALWNDVGGTNEGFDVRLNDESGTDIAGASNPKVDGMVSGTFNPGGAALLSVFDGQDASGLWRLTIVDDSGGDTGTLFSWGLVVTY
jgi:subtilisin-like proprotein convertase family protein